jgi:hypothetical protein
VSIDAEYLFEITKDRNLVANFEKIEEPEDPEQPEEPGEGVEELTSSFNIYPNPVSDMLFIEIEVEIEEVSIFDIYGRIQNLSNSATQQLSNSIDVADLNNGIYFVKIKTENGEAVKSFVKN